MEQEKYLDLGWANDWSEEKWRMPDGSILLKKSDTTPQQVKQCQQLQHLLREVNIGRCLYSVYCDICKITYRMDSSD